ncbi:MULTISPECIES: CerR family C-terminal domain-containing protein [Paraburkholderia]|uniref:TetR family transcriptional regulator n=1 Tax=Paraburkholderia tropica TaxID=92647 RepID=A0A1A5X1R7_9BURK|nr:MULTISPECIES: CerR family C-terminal domain-containing protein [Paraburkholderia]MBB2979034.1 AcrR family transcriptional regulator [Paraburkholderia tropica]MBB2999135.1 AcrR family transcriptional regulator [Paraburkholderia tropica]MBB6318965.1 AcrR family transcriptional regulator [Paraburkholderia tropica]MDE1138864.1 CerR family C-terminal domain-containing protein [Paraburkholderia tropica]OBR46998.1 TetR family transcriptional regulator [Paraburkholderia tropica]
MNDTKPLRRPKAGGYARGDETRRKIIEAAISLFGKHGFEGASTRDIAARAGVNAPALQYYFESKEGLYCACAESLADESWQSFEPAVLRARAVLERNGDTAELIDAFLDIQRAVADRTFVKRSDPDQRLFFAREQGGGEPESGSEVLRQRVRAPLNEVNITLLARISGMSADDPLTVMRMLSLYGQFLLFYIARRVTLSTLKWDDIDAERAEFLKANIADQTRVLLEHWSRQGGTDGEKRVAEKTDSTPAKTATR